MGNCTVLYRIIVLGCPFKTSVTITLIMYSCSVFSYIIQRFHASYQFCTIWPESAAQILLFPPFSWSSLATLIFFFLVPTVISSLNTEYKVVTLYLVCRPADLSRWCDILLSGCFIHFFFFGCLFLLLKYCWSSSHCIWNSCCLPI